VKIKKKTENKQETKAPRMKVISQTINQSILIFIRNKVQREKEVKKKQRQTSKHKECSKYNHTAFSLNDYRG